MRHREKNLTGRKQLVIGRNKSIVVIGDCHAHYLRIMFTVILPIEVLGNIKKTSILLVSFIVNSSYLVNALKQIQHSKELSRSFRNRKIIGFFNTKYILKAKDTDIVYELKTKERVVVYILNFCIGKELISAGIDNRIDTIRRCLKNQHRRTLSPIQVLNTEMRSKQWINRRPKMEFPA
jgi:hypothetical protein